MRHLGREQGCSTYRDSNRFVVVISGRGSHFVTKSGNCVCIPFRRLQKYTPFTRRRFFFQWRTSGNLYIPKSNDPTIRSVVVSTQAANVLICLMSFPQYTSIVWFIPYMYLPQMGTTQTPVSIGVDARSLMNILQQA